MSAAVQEKTGFYSLSPVFQPLLDELNSLPSVNFIAATSEVGIPVDQEAERLRYVWKMQEKFSSQLKARRGFSKEIENWLFQELTGSPMPTEVLSKPLNSSVQINAEVYSRIPDNTPPKKTGVEKTYFSDVSTGILDYFKAPPDSIIGKLIAKARKDPNNPLETNLLGGGLPSDKLLLQFKQNVFDPALKRIIKWDQNQMDLILAMLQYPKRAGGDNIFLRSVADQYLNPDVSNKLTSIHGNDKIQEGMFMTHGGSQEALDLMLQTLIEIRHDKSQPTILTVTDPVYTGLLLAAEKYLKAGLLKFRVVPIQMDGSIDPALLNEALSDPNCLGFYLSEGNPLPKAIPNKKDLAELIKLKHPNKFVFEDRAYRRLGLDENNTFFNFIPDQTVVYETLSKSAAPGLRTGITFSGTIAEDSIKLFGTMQHTHYATTLGPPGVVGAVIYAIMENDQETGNFTKHYSEVAREYARKRNLYRQTYLECLNILKENQDYDFDGEVIVDIGMFGWRKTAVDSLDYADFGAEELNLFSLPGSACTPAQEYISGPYYGNSNYYMRQNLTWEEDEPLKVGIVKDVLLELFFSNILIEEKEKIAYQLLNQAVQYGNEQHRPEIERFIKRAKAYNWQYPFSKN
ncbi:hypothetical protein A3D78_04990 [Candidatus Gottesmanbacteria bacterium RIFCSPHIGHO2_02_FULL_39_14]|uniref:Aminotransferase class I/classII domain-containing protein n=1 Tax=Candidatus Gottesmanbacteria bacterium RIFCSPHIGHO2_02_FULL_39_14 TaxID=1798383 RepID=A0A1F5ZW74_9BACT|nr:MAG: hypothetical protein A3D78_04990 [Candidatus Gottesmanbacteria bacterium RIFCSPHIGHO2_02_FULL_39_14]